MLGNGAGLASNGVLAEKVMANTIVNDCFVNDRRIIENVITTNSDQNGLVEECEIEPMTDCVQVRSLEEDGVVLG